VSDMSDMAGALGPLSTRAVETAARDLGMEPLALARRLNQGDIARLVHLLNACLAHVEHTGLRRRTEELLMSVTDGRMPDQRPESELDWALKVAKRRRTPSDGSPEPDAGRGDEEE